MSDNQEIRFAPAGTRPSLQDVSEAILKTSSMAG